MSMKKLTTIFAILFSFAVLSAQSQASFHNFKTTDIWGDEFDFAQLKGKKVLIVNTASECGYTGQFEALQRLYERFGGDNFVILGFPSNSFDQELATDAEIANFCTSNYGVRFPMMTETTVRGDNIHPIFEWLTKKSLNGLMDIDLTWNFQKFMVDENGRLVDFAEPAVNPLSDKIVDWLRGN